MPSLSPPIPTNSYSVFLSSGADADELRDRVNELFAAANRALVTRNAKVRIDVRRWENHAPHRAQNRINEEFVAEAKNSQLTIALLLREIRPGTLEELTAVLNETTKDVALLWFRDDGELPSEELQDFLKTYGDALLYSEVGPPGEARSWYSVVHLLVDFLLRVIETELGDQQEIFYETR